MYLDEYMVEQTESVESDPIRPDPIRVDTLDVDYSLSWTDTESR